MLRKLKWKILAARRLRSTGLKYTKTIRKVIYSLIGYPYKCVFCMTRHISLQNLYRFWSLFEGEKFHTFYNGLQSFNMTDTYKTVMINLLNDHPKLHRYREHFMKAATREVRMFYKWSNTMKTYVNVSSNLIRKQSQKFNSYEHCPPND
jgi:hypothetical protein